MKATTLFGMALFGLSSVVASLDLESEPRDMVPREFAAEDGSVSTIYINPEIHFTRSTTPNSVNKLFRKRAPAYTADSNQEYCSETFPSFDTSANAPLKTDCDQIARYMETVSGYYTVQPADFGADGWARLYRSGTCTFAARMFRPETLRVGTNDIRFYIVTYSGNAQNGRIGAQGTMSCYNGQKIVFADWGLIRS